MTRIEHVSARSASGLRAFHANLGADELVTTLLWAAATGITGALATILLRHCISALVQLESGHAMDLVEAPARCRHDRASPFPPSAA